MARHVAVTCQNLVKPGGMILETFQEYCIGDLYSIIGCRPRGYIYESRQMYSDVICWCVRCCSQVQSPDTVIHINGSPGPSRYSE